MHHILAPGSSCRVELAALNPGDCNAPLQLLHLGSDHDGDGSYNTGTDDDGTPLHKATREGDVAEIQLLLAAGADPNSADCVGVTPLYMAAQRGLAAAVEELLAVSSGRKCKRPGPAGFKAPLCALAWSVTCAGQGIDHG